MPVASHAHAEPAALALLSAAERTDQEYWKMRTWLFANQFDLALPALGRYAEQAGLDRQELMSAVSAKKHGVENREDLAAAEALGITGTPSFVLGTTDGHTIQGERIVGAKAFQFFDSRLRALLAKSAISETLNEPKAR
jgi:protein-disulfide isomerase